jgi:hypothetical protein
MQLDELPRQGQAQASTFHLLVRSPDLPELLEDRLLVLRRDADAGSLTDTSTDPSTGMPPSGVNLIAFESRFSTTCRIFLSSARTCSTRSLDTHMQHDAVPPGALADEGQGIVERRWEIERSSR